MRKEDLRLAADLTTDMIANMGKEGKNSRILDSFLLHLAGGWPHMDGRNLINPLPGIGAQVKPLWAVVGCAAGGRQIFSCWVG